MRKHFQKVNHIQGQTLRDRAVVLRQAYQESGGMRHDGYQGQSHQSWIHQSIQKLKSNYDKILTPPGRGFEKASLQQGTCCGRQCRIKKDKIPNIHWI